MSNKTGLAMDIVTATEIWKRAKQGKVQGFETMTLEDAKIVLADAYVAGIREDSGEALPIGEIQDDRRRKMAAEALSLLWDAMELSGSDAGIKLPGSENRAKYRQAYLHIGKMLLGDDCPEKEVLT